MEIKREDSLHTLILQDCLALSRQKLRFSLALRVPPSSSIRPDPKWWSIKGGNQPFRGRLTGACRRIAFRVAARRIASNRGCQNRPLWLVPLLSRPLRCRFHYPRKCRGVGHGGWTAEDSQSFQALCGLVLWDQESCRNCRENDAPGPPQREKDGSDKRQIAKVGVLIEEHTFLARVSNRFPFPSARYP